MQENVIPPTGYRRKPLPELLKAIDDCQSISQLCALVQHEHIVIQMKSQQAASNIPYRELPKNPAISPVESLRAQIREAAIAMARQHSKEDLIRAVETCPTAGQKRAYRDTDEESAFSLMSAAAQAQRRRADARYHAAGAPQTAGA